MHFIHHQDEQSMYRMQGPMGNFGAFHTSDGKRCGIPQQTSKVRFRSLIKTFTAPINDRYGPLHRARPPPAAIGHQQHQQQNKIFRLTKFQPQAIRGKTTMIFLILTAIILIFHPADHGENTMCLTIIKKNCVVLGHVACLGNRRGIVGMVALGIAIWKFSESYPFTRCRVAFMFQIRVSCWWLVRGHSGVDESNDVTLLLPPK